MILWLASKIGISLGLTIIIEIFFAYRRGIRNKQDLLLIGMVNVLTNPAVVLIYTWVTTTTSFNWIVITILLEGAAVAIEGHYFSKYGKAIENPYLFSLYINFMSYSLGELFNFLIN